MTGGDLVLLVDGRRAGIVRNGLSGPQLLYDQRLRRGEERKHRCQQRSRFL